ncbi:copper-binding protein [Microvirga sp. 2MCAF38]|uniref:copper-binding protein n=1 Tax=Microvirga sp. 2MCAF38 TaxID=3232989 RepID=UPI003F998E8D
MKRINFATAGFFAGLVLSGQAFAQALPVVAATVTKIDESAGKITLNHGPIKNLDMAGMTMVFRARDPAMLKEVKVGDKVQFTADRVNGQLTVTSIMESK